MPWPDSVPLPHVSEFTQKKDVLWWLEEAFLWIKDKHDGSIIITFDSNSNYLRAVDILMGLVKHKKYKFFDTIESMTPEQHHKLYNQVIRELGYTERI